MNERKERGIAEDNKFKCKSCEHIEFIGRDDYPYCYEMFKLGWGIMKVPISINSVHKLCPLKVIKMNEKEKRGVREDNSEGMKIKESWSISELLLFIDYCEKVITEKRMCFGFKEMSISDKERLDEIRHILTERNCFPKEMKKVKTDKIDKLNKEVKKWIEENEKKRKEYKKFFKGKKWNKKQIKEMKKKEVIK